MAGVGYPQLSAVIECADAAHGLGGLIVAVRILNNKNIKGWRMYESR